MSTTDQAAATARPAPVTSAHGQAIALHVTDEYRGHLVEVYRTVEPQPTGGPDDRHRWYDRIVWDDGTADAYARRVPESIQGNTGKIVKRARATIDQSIREDELYPQMLGALEHFAGEAAGWTDTPAAVEPGDLVAIYSRGQWRPGIVDKVARTGTVTVAYITQGGLDEAQRYRGPDARAQVTRKADKVENLKERGRPGRPAPTPVARRADRKALEGLELVRANEARRAAAAEDAAAWAALQSPELDALLGAFMAAEAALDAGKGSFPETRDAFQAMQAAAPDGWSAPRRARELGL